MSLQKATPGPSILTHLRVGLYAGLLAGVLLGLIECGWLWKNSWNNLGPGTLLYAALLYAIQVGLTGIAVGALLFLFQVVVKRQIGKRTDLYALMLALLLAPGLVLLARMHIGRDLLFNEPFPIWGNLALLASLFLLFFSFLLPLRALLKQRPFSFLAEARGTAALLAVILLSLFAAAMTGGQETDAREPRGPAPTAGTGRTPAPHILLIMIDTLRADRLSCYGYRGNATAAIDALAGDGVLFQFNIAHASWTRPATASLLTSLHPESHKTYDLDQQLPDELTTLPEALGEQGYRTVGYVNNINVNQSFNFDQGFNEFTYLAPKYLFLADESSSKLAGHWFMRKVRKILNKKRRVEEFYQDADLVNEHLLADLETAPGNRPTFFFVQYMDPHDPYFVHPYNGEALNLVETPDPGPSRVEEVSLLYDGEISFLDQRLGAVFQRMRELGIYDDTLIVLTADHGEELYDHQGWFHGSTLYQELIQVPLIIKLPGNELAGTEVSHLARQVDIASTILGQVGLPLPESFQGIDLISALIDARTGDTTSAPLETDSAESPAWPVENVTAKTIFRGTEIHSLIADGWKLVRATEGNARGLPNVELFRLDQDGQEQRDLANAHPDRVIEMGRLLDQELAAALASGASEAQSQELDADTQARLKALGYLD